ncbi:alpha/beta hydrolase [Flexibacterium corallicola]|uniref:alpha/beta hydrolase n=1 Tax=Flexibacterium corallicola TaxID=3037259 RepID=UPI00286F96AC|nr:alpha/beta hydrolase [Pseudovibrio sp. M1P-2-3]
MAISLEPAAGTSEETILIATTRERSEQENTLYGGERGNSVLDFASVTVSIPPTHVPGEIEWPSSPPGDPETDFVVRNADFIDGSAQFTGALRRQIAKRPFEQRSSMVFIHGYNTLFAEAIFRYAQFSHDSEFAGVPVLFTWASRGDVTNYVYDSNSATIARDGLEELLLTVSNNTPDSVYIVAHSMGNWTLLETLRQMKIDGNNILENKRVFVVLAAPDVDVDVFKQQLKRIGPTANPFVVMLSRDDRALRLSRRIAGGKDRVGAYVNDEELADLGVIVLDLTDVQSNDASRHTKFAEIASDIPQIRQLIRKNSIGRRAKDRTFSSTFATAGQGVGTIIGRATDVVITLPRTLLTPNTTR